ncbi:hypothetical protein NDU88_001790 [Pleurodeles waltl]|uniref:Uncharacterized protein n=1 Tax=Pleurodeles waltl TaxID=8319 RepID=A0AAV7T0H3_PLEWA|nr:hypothetical protein NDU88_001790 [Pleurodeles waltl]
MALKNGRISGENWENWVNIKARPLGGGTLVKRSAKNLSCSDPAVRRFRIGLGKISDRAASGSTVQTAMRDAGSKMKSKTQPQPAIMKYLTRGAQDKGIAGSHQQPDTRSKDAMKKSEVIEVVQGVIQNREGLENSPVYRDEAQSEMENRLPNK